MGVEAIKAYNTTLTDPNIILYLKLDKKCYFPGEYVDGQVCLYAANDRNYNTLYLRLQGWEHVKIYSEEHERQSNLFQNYDGLFLLVTFNGYIKAGQYSFPFSFLLPSMITGSLHYSANQPGYIRYILKAILVHPISQHQNQAHEVVLNILQKPRMDISSTSMTKNANQKCCNCFSNNGKFQITLTCQKRFVKNGESINIGVMIDNSQGKIKINNGKVIFRENIVQIDANYGIYQNNILTQNILLQINETEKGEKQQLHQKIVIPKDLFDGTAIGSIIARFFTLHLQVVYGCCSDEAEECQIHLFLQCTKPRIVNYKNIPLNGWNPTKFPKYVYQNMKPFIYIPSPLLPYLNMPQNKENTKKRIKHKNSVQDQQSNIKYSQLHNIYAFQSKFNKDQLNSEGQLMKQEFTPQLSMTQKSIIEKQITRRRQL